jgi:hypothetical protein
MSSSLGFTLNGSPLNVSVTQFNPLSNITPSGSWNYYYYSCSTSTENIQISNPSNLTLNVCVYAQGGLGGAYGNINKNLGEGYSGSFTSATGGGGGGGQVVNMTNFNSQNFTILLNKLGVFAPCQLIPNPTPQAPTSVPINIAQGYSGGYGSTLYATSNPLGGSGGKGGQGGTGGGAAGNAGKGGSCQVKDQFGDTASYQGPSGLLGSGYYPNNTGSSLTNTPNSTLVSFADGTTANIATAGKQAQSGNLAGFLIYYQV